MRVTKREVPRNVKMDVFVEHGNGRIIVANILQFARFGARLLGKFAPRAFLRRFAGVQFASGCLQQNPGKRISVLPHHDHVALLRERHDADRPGMADHLARGESAVRQAHGVFKKMNDLSLKNLLGGYGLLK
jgi:hypothetical protein